MLDFIQSMMIVILIVIAVFNLSTTKRIIAWMEMVHQRLFNESLYTRDEE